jgi:hypothetical protein
MDVSEERAISIFRADEEADYKSTRSRHRADPAGTEQILQDPYSVFSSTLKLEVTFPERKLNFNGISGVISMKTVFSVTIAVRNSVPTNVVNPTLISPSFAKFYQHLTIYVTCVVIIITMIIIN